MQTSQLTIFRTMSTNRRIIFIVPLMAAIISMVLLFLALWNSWFGTRGDSHQFCEALRPGIIMQPANTWSNLGFIVAGLLIAWESMHRKHADVNNPFTRSQFYPSFFATIAVLLGPGSMAMHASTSHIGGFFDMLSMYMVASFMFMYAITRLLRWHQAIWSFVFYLIALSICLVVHFLPNYYVFGFLESIIAAFGTFTVGASIIELYLIFGRRGSINYKWAFGFMGAFLLAFAIWYPSRTGGPWCIPDSLIQGHGAWHLLDAFSVYCLYRYYVSEDQPVLES